MIWGFELFIEKLITNIIGIVFRHQLTRDIIKKYQASESSSNFKRERVAQGHVNENLNSEYQELGELSPSSTYASLQ